MWIQLVAQRVEPRISRRGFGPQQTFSFLCRLTPLLDAVVKTAPEKKDNCSLKRVDQPPRPVHVPQTGGGNVGKNRGNRSDDRRPRKRSCLQGQPAHRAFDHRSAYWTKYATGKKQRSYKQRIIAENSAFLGVRKRDHQNQNVEEAPAHYLKLPERRKFGLFAG